GFREPGVEPLSQLLALVLHGEIDASRRTAEQRGTCASLEVVRSNRAAERQREVRVCVDAAGQDEQAARIDVRVTSLGEPCADRGDTAVFDAQVGGVAIGRGDDRAVADAEAHGTAQRAARGANEAPRSCTTSVCTFCSDRRSAPGSGAPPDATASAGSES